MGGLLRSLDAKWVDRPDVISSAGYKPLQLKIAQQCGLTIPSTIITSNPRHARMFAEGASEQIITKPLISAFIAEEGGVFSSFYTSVIEPDEFDQLERVRFAPALLQRFVPKDYEVRLTVIGSRMFTAEIRGESAASKIDWRTSYEELKYAEGTLPTAVRESVSALMQQLQLNFGAIDFVVRPDGEWVFLEINPSGQWAWIEEALDLPMRSTLADLLTT